jgi:CRP-like cAMP-binding protein
MSDFLTVHFQPGERIFSAGEPADHLYIIQSGTVQLLTSQGDVFAEVPTGQSFGEQAFLRGGIRGASAQARDQVVCLQMTTEDAGNLINKSSPLLVTICEALLLQQSMNNALHRGT